MTAFRIGVMMLVAPASLLALWLALFMLAEYVDRNGWPGVIVSAWVLVAVSMMVWGLR